MNKVTINLVFCNLVVLFYKKNNNRFFYVDKIVSKVDYPISVKFFSAEIVVGGDYRFEGYDLEFEVSLIKSINGINKEQTFLLTPIKRKLKFTDLNCYYKVSSVFTFDKSISIDETDMFLITNKMNKEPLFFKALVKKYDFIIENDFVIKAISKHNKQEINIDNFLVEEYDDYYIVFFNELYSFKTIFVNSDKIFVPEVLRTQDLLKDIFYDYSADFFSCVSHDNDVTELKLEYEDGTIETISIKTYSSKNDITTKKDGYYIENSEIKTITVLTNGSYVISCYDNKIVNSNFIKNTNDIIFKAEKKFEVDLKTITDFSNFSINKKYKYDGSSFVEDDDGFIVLNEYTNEDLICLEGNYFKNSYYSKAKKINFDDDFYNSNFKNVKM